MASPAFIYAFDNLGPSRFAELCGLLLGARFRGFLLGGVGADGGVDAEIDPVIGEWNPESASPILTEVIQSGDKVIFQFKHKVTARVGQTKARTQLLNLYRKTTELNKPLIKKLNAYVLVTNIEVNAKFRAKFIKQCRITNPAIKHYQIIGLDELESWVTGEPQIRHLFFPTIFGEPRFNLKIKLDVGIAALSANGVLGMDLDKAIHFLAISVLNVGTVPSYVSGVTFRAIIDSEIKGMSLLEIDKKDYVSQQNPLPGAIVEPGRKLDYRFRFLDLREILKQGKSVFLTEVVVFDDIENRYSGQLTDDLRKAIKTQL
jgi:hypothetical protein